MESAKTAIFGGRLDIRWPVGEKQCQLSLLEGDDAYFRYGQRTAIYLDAPGGVLRPHLARELGTRLIEMAVIAERAG